MKHINYKLPFIFFLLILFFPVVAHAQSYGSSSGGGGGGTSNPTCTNPMPGAPILFDPNNSIFPKPSNGQVTLHWAKASGGNDYAVYYGLSSGNYIFSSFGLGNVDNTTINSLGNGVYYFAVQARNSCMPGPMSAEYSVKLGGSGNQLVAANFVPIAQANPQTVLPSTQTQTPTTGNNQTLSPSPTTQQVQTQTPNIPTVSVSQPQQSTGNWFDAIISFFRHLFGG